MSKQTKPIIYDYQQFASLLADRIYTAEVKTATPSRAQNKVQVRISWKDPDGTHGLGYMSLATYDAIALADGSRSPPRTQEFIYDVFRIRNWASLRSIAEHGSDAYSRDCLSKLEKKLNALSVFNTGKKSHALKNAAIGAIKMCVKSGVLQRALDNREKLKAERYLDRSVLFALRNGLNDSEINEIIKLAYVKHVHDS